MLCAAVLVLGVGRAVAAPERTLTFALHFSPVTRPRRIACASSSRSRGRTSPPSTARSWRARGGSRLLPLALRGPEAQEAV